MLARRITIWASNGRRHLQGRESSHAPKAGLSSNVDTTFIRRDGSGQPIWPHSYPHRLLLASGQGRGGESFGRLWRQNTFAP